MNNKSSLTFGLKTAFKTSIPAVAFVVTLTTTSIAKATSFIPSDIVWLLDTSGSMGGDINEVKSRIGDFDQAMIDSGIDARYALVRFGGNETLIQDLTDFSTFTTPGSPFNLLRTNGGGTERGSRAVNVALANTSFRPGSVKNFILVTDEDDDSSFGDFSAASLSLTETDTLFNFI
ncbi:MAG: VWA domain-containing protein, partial [Okeania sp. SIO2H7]|nr:VWA domain-containing protein [Okeania sp. SIO2H7]